MIKNQAGQKWVVFAFQGASGVTPGAPVTGDAANITANLRPDGGAANAVDDTNPTELERGFYVFDLTQAETNANNIAIAPVSSTANVNVIGFPPALYTTEVPTKLLKYFQLALRSDDAIATDNATELTAINADGGSGAGDYAVGDSQEGLRDALPTEANNSAIAHWDTVLSYSSDTITLATAPTRIDEFNTLDVVVIDGDTDERYSGYVVDTTLAPNTIVLSNTPAFTPASGDRVAVYTTRTNFTKVTTDAIVADTNDLQTNQGNWLTATGFSTHSAADVRTEMDNNSTKLSDIVADTNQLQTDWVDGGRLDLIVDAILSDSNNLNDQAIAEIASATDIPATPTLRQAIMLVYQWLRNNTEATTTERKIRNDAGSVVLEGDMTDSAGAFTQGKLGNPD